MSLIGKSVSLLVMDNTRKLKFRAVMKSLFIPDLLKFSFMGSLVSDQRVRLELTLPRCEVLLLLCALSAAGVLNFLQD